MDESTKMTKRNHNEPLLIDAPGAICDLSRMFVLSNACQSE
jgi:hypothetical protein